MNYISFNKGARQISDYVAKLAQLPAGTLITDWHRDNDTTRALLDACQAQGSRLLIQADDWATQRSPMWVASFVNTHAAHPAFAGWYFDEPGQKRQTLARYMDLLNRLHAMSDKLTVAVFGLFTELADGFAGHARLEGVDNYWDDPTRPKSRDEGWSEYAQFVDALLAAHARTSYGGAYCSVVTAYAKPAAKWHAVAADMARTREYLKTAAVKTADGAVYSVGNRLTTTMLYASMVDAQTVGYMEHQPTFDEVLKFATTAAPPTGNTLVVNVEKLRARGVTQIVIDL